LKMASKWDIGMKKRCIRIYERKRDTKHEWISNIIGDL